MSALKNRFVEFHKDKRLRFAQHRFSAKCYNNKFRLR